MVIPLMISFFTISTDLEAGPKINSSEPNLDDKNHKNDYNPFLPNVQIMPDFRADRCCRLTLI